jgi:hypothetical protein
MKMRSFRPECFGALCLTISMASSPLRGAADLMHQLGMKVDLDVGGTMFPETLYHELIVITQ